MRLVKPIQDLDLDHVIKQLVLLLKGRSRLEEEFDLATSLLFLEPVCHVQRISLFRKIDEKDPFYGYWIQDTATCTYATIGATPDKAIFHNGFVINHGGHHFLKGVYVGTTYEQLKEVQKTLGIEIDDQDLRRLVHSGEPAYFVRPEFPQKCPVYELDDVKLVHVARLAGFVTELEQPDEKYQRQTRLVEVGDRLVLLPVNDTWMVPLGVFPADWLPEERYRRV